MNPLYEPLPKKVEVGGIPYPVKTDFRAVLKLIGEVKQAGEPGSRLFLILPGYTKKRFRRTSMGPSRQSRISLPASGQQKREKSVKAVESRRSAMRRMHRISSAISGTITGIDLLACKYLHWQKFQMLLEGLPDDSGTKIRIGYRSIDAGKIRDKQERQRIQKIQRAISLEDERDEEQIGDLFAAAMWGD